MKNFGSTCWNRNRGARQKMVVEEEAPHGVTKIGTHSLTYPSLPIVPINSHSLSLSHFGKLPKRWCKIIQWLKMGKRSKERLTTPTTTRRRSLEGSKQSPSSLVTHSFISFLNLGLFNSFIFIDSSTDFLCSGTQFWALELEVEQKLA